MSPAALVAAAALAALMASCAGAAAPRVPAPGEPPPVAGPDVQVPWTQMTRGQRIDFMVTTVLPRMKAELAAFDGRRFARVDCATCHGDSAADGSYRLPNPKLTPLSAADGFARHRKAAPEMMKFMMDRVVPDTAAMLGQAPFDPATRTGFGCFECHPRAREP